MKKITEKDSGIWIGAHRGIDQGIEIIQTAIDAGWDTYIPKAWLDYNLFSENHEDYWDAWIDAQEFLDTLAPEGYEFGHNKDFDWGMYPKDQLIQNKDHPITYFLDLEELYNRPLPKKFLGSLKIATKENHNGKE